MSATITCFDYEGHPHQVPASKIKPRASCYGILVSEDKIVLSRDEGKDRWDIPGGGLEEGESLEENLKREFFEETGLEIVGEVEFIKTIHEFYYSNGYDEAWSSTRHYFKIHQVKGELKKTINNLGTAEADWVNLENLDKYNVKSNVNALIKQVTNI